MDIPTNIINSVKTLIDTAEVAGWQHTSAADVITSEKINMQFKNVGAENYKDYGLFMLLIEIDLTLSDEFLNCLKLCYVASDKVLFVQTCLGTYPYFESLFRHPDTLDGAYIRSLQ